MVYRIEVAGRIFESTDHRELIRLAVQVKATSNRESADSPGIRLDTVGFGLEPIRRMNYA